MGQNSNAVRATSFVPSTNVGPITENEAAKSFAAVVLHFDAGTLATGARRTKEAAKYWKAGRRCPNVSSMINLAAEQDVVWEWFQHEVQKRRMRNATGIYAELQQRAMKGGQDAAEARAMLAAIDRGR